MINKITSKKKPDLKNFRRLGFDNIKINSENKANAFKKKKKRSILPFNTSYLNKQSRYVIAICFVSLCLLIYTSPILSLLWLIVPTGYFLINYKYKSISKIW